MATPRLVGRDRELAVLAGLIARGRTAGQALVLIGDPGIGKSALLTAVEAEARAAGYRVLSAVGVESEAQLPFAGLHQLLRPALREAGQLLPAHRRALLAAFGLADGPAPEPFLIALAAVGLLGAVGADRPLAVLADDVQWLDPQSQEVLTFMARRAAPHPVLIIGAARTGHPGPYLQAGLPELRIGPLDEAAADEVARGGAGMLDAAGRRAIVRMAAGNPLALLELPRTWPGAAAAASGQAPTLSARLERAFAGRLAGLPPRTRDAVLVAAVDSASAVDEILAAASVLSAAVLSASVLSAATGDDPLRPAAEAGLLSVAGGQVSFRHPLVRSGVLQSETLTRRMAANAALAEVLTDEPYRRTWHRAQSIVGPDDEVADELEANAAVALSRGAAMSAIGDLQRSAQLTSIPAVRGHRLLMAAEQAFAVGRTDLVDHLVRQAADTDLSELDQARTQWLREIFNDGVPGDAVRVRELCASARQADQAGDRDLALKLLLGAALRCWWADTGPAARARVVEVAGELEGGAGDPRYVAVLAVAEPVGQCAVVMDLLSGFPGPDTSDADALYVLGMAAHAIGDTVRSIDFSSRAEKTLRETGRLGLLSQVLSMQVMDWLELGDWDRAAAAAEEGVRLAAETGQPIWRAGTLVCDALNHAFRGQAEQAFRYAAEAELVLSQRRVNDLLSCVALARGVAEASTGQHASAYREFRRMFEPGDPCFHQRERYDGVMFLADAAVRAGQRDDARQVVAGLELLAAATPAPQLHVHLAYARAVLADDSEAGPFYADLMARDLSRRPWAGARVALAYGRWLLRQGRYRASEEVLRPLPDAFTRIGAADWACLARSELLLAAAGRPGSGDRFPAGGGAECQPTS
jgi:tetratricopeptide (TPR) repeat protein